ncbi:hypothetical protein [Kitasatospora cinereorecta]|uniref:Uncharacterized protein n=2 Tax=Kitasatospora cinereorecta TaxID=285560 RepID=A0ABW0VJ67_9ACTN
MAQQQESADSEVEPSADALEGAEAAEALGSTSEARGWRRLLQVPWLVLATVVTTAATWGCTWLLTSATEADPIAISFTSDPQQIAGSPSAGRQMLIPPTQRTVGTPGAGCDGFHAWGVANHAVDSGVTTVQIIAQGQTDSAVLIRAMKIKVLAKAVPLQGIATVCATAGGVSSRGLATNLDDIQPEVSYSGAEGSPFGFTLAKGETESFNLTATAEAGYYRWQIVLDTVVDGKPQSLTIGPAQGFETTSGNSNAPAWSWNWKDSWSLTGVPGRAETVPAGSPLTVIPH